jgi:hypothetical protein
MGAIQVKNVPADLHEALRRRAADEGMDLQDYVLMLIRRDLGKPTLREWLEEVRSHPVNPSLPSGAELIRELRDERAAGR